MNEYLLDDEEVEAITEEQRHKQMMGAFGQLIATIEAKNENSSNEELQELLNANKGMIADFLKKVKEISQPQQPNVSVEVNQDKVTNSLQEMSDKIISGLQSLEKQIKILNEKPLAKWEAVITDRVAYGFASRIILKQIN